MEILLMADGMERGGAETHIETLARGLTRNGHRVTLFSGGGETAERLARAGVGLLTAPRVGRSPIRAFRAGRRLRKLLRERRFDLIHAHTRATAWLMRGAARRAGVPGVVTIHARFPGGPFSRLCFRADAFIAVSEDLRAHAADRLGIPPERLTVIPNGIDGARFFPPFPRRHNATKEILFVSRLDHDCAKGAFLLCEVAARLAESVAEWQKGTIFNDRCAGIPPFRVTLAGGGACLPELRERAGRVNFLLGREVVRAVDPNGVSGGLPSLLRRADIFVGVSRAAMEAAFCGCAVLLCGNEGYGGVLTPDRADLAAGNFCCRGEPTATADRLCRDLSALLRDPALCRALGEADRAWLTAAFPAGDMIRATLAVYADLLSVSGEKRERERIEKGPRVCVGGYAGCGNLGDDAVLTALLAGLREHGVPAGSVTVLSGDPTRDRARFGARCVYRFSPVGVLRAIRRSDLFVLGGGNLLQNRTGNRSLAYYLLLLRLARHAGCETVLLGGVGPLSGRFARRAVARELSFCRVLLLRDGASVDLLRALGIPVSRTGADLAHLLPRPPRFRAAFLLRSLGVSRPFVLIFPGSGPTENMTAPSAAAFSALPGVPVLAFSDLKRDAFRIYALQKSLSFPVFCPRDLSELTALIAAAELVISARLHPLILAVSCAVRAVGLSVTDPKTDAFCRAAGLPRLPSLSALPSLTLPVAPADPLPFLKKAEKDLAIFAGMCYHKSGAFVRGRRPRTARPRA